MGLVTVGLGADVTGTQGKWPSALFGRTVVVAAVVAVVCSLGACSIVGGPRLRVPDMADGKILGSVEMPGVEAGDPWLWVRCRTASKVTRARSK